MTPEQPPRHTHFVNVIGAIDETGDCVVLELMSGFRGDGNSVNVQRELLVALPRHTVADLAAKLAKYLPAGGEAPASAGTDQKDEFCVIQRVIE